MADDLTVELVRLRAIEQAATSGEWYAEPNTGAGRVWVQIGARHWAGADLEPLFNYRTRREPATEEERQRQFRQREADAAFIVTARRAMPLLVGAVEAVLKLHAPVDRGRVMRCCRGCEEVDGEFHEGFCHEWPCPTYEAIRAALAGEEASDGK